MAALFGALLLLLLLLVAPARAPSSCTSSSTATFDFANVTNPAIANATRGCHFSPLDHQLFYVYSQMVYDESFEQAISMHGAPDGGGLRATLQQPGVSMGWQNATKGGPGVAWVDDVDAAFNGNVSVALNSTAASGARVGIAARGLYHQGHALAAGRPYGGYLAVRAAAASVVHVRLEDWGAEPSGAAGSVILAHAALAHPGSGGWILLNFSLVPNASTRCVPFAFGKAPLNCGIPNSQSAFPPSATGSCVVCGGTLTVSVEGGAAASVDQVFLEPGEWGRYRGLHMHRAAAEWLLKMGTKMLRYGGTFTETVQGDWESSRGPAWLRPPCTAGRGAGGRGSCHLTKLSRWTRGWGPLEVIMFCEAAGIECVVGVAAGQTAQQLSELVEYLYGDAATVYGRLRIADGHAAPYRLRSLSVEVGNEGCMSEFVGSFAPKAAAMEAAAAKHGMGGKLRYVTGSYLGIEAISSKCASGGPNATMAVLREVAAAGLCGQLVVDTHIGPSPLGNADKIGFAQTLQDMGRRAGCVGLKLAILEENSCHNHFKRALSNGGCASGLQSIPSLSGAATSQCFTAAAHADGCGEGHIILMPNFTWAAPPFYASKMVYDSYLPLAIDASATPTCVAPACALQNMSVFGAVSDDGASAVLRFVNANDCSVDATLVLKGAVFAAAVAVQTLVSPIDVSDPLWVAQRGGWNSPQRPTFISPRNSSWDMAAGGGVYRVPAQSFVVMRLKKRPLKTTDAASSEVCKSDEDCSLLGTCTQGACVCTKGWMGSSCGRMDLGPLDITLGYQNATEASWGGRPLKDPETGKWTMMLVEIANQCPFALFELNSVVIKAVSTTDSIGGPYRKEAVVLPPFHHNPQWVGPTADADYLMFFIGASNANVTKKVLDCRAPLPLPPIPPGSNVQNQTARQPSNGFVSMASVRCGKGSAKDCLSGEPGSAAAPGWVQSTRVILDSEHGNQTSPFCLENNPAPYLAEDGSVTLVFRSNGCVRVASTGGEHLGVAVANHWSEPFVRHPTPIIVPGFGPDGEACEGYCFENEDPFLFRRTHVTNDGVAQHSWHLIVHQQGHKNICSNEPEVDGSIAGHACGAHFFAHARTGPWTMSPEPAYTPNVTLTNGSSATFLARQRPQLAFHSDGSPAFLFNGGNFFGNNPDICNGTDGRPSATACPTHTYAHAFKADDDAIRRRYEMWFGSSGKLSGGGALFWSLVVLPASVAYCAALLAANAATKETVHGWLADPGYVDPDYESRSCELSWVNFSGRLDWFVVSHLLGWTVKSIMLRNSGLCWFISVLWELSELYLLPIFPNFAECWWDNVLLDVFLANAGGILIGSLVVAHFELEEHDWHRAPLSGVLLLVAFLVIDLDLFLAKRVFLMPTDSPLLLWRIILWCAMGVRTARRLFEVNAGGGAEAKDAVTGKPKGAQPGRPTGLDLQAKLAVAVLLLETSLVWRSLWSSFKDSDFDPKLQQGFHEAGRNGAPPQPPQLQRDMIVDQYLSTWLVLVVTISTLFLFVSTACCDAGPSSLRNCLPMVAVWMVVFWWFGAGLDFVDIGSYPRGD